MLITRLSAGFSHLREHKFGHGFADTVDSFCNCRTNCIEDTEHFLLHCSIYLNERQIMFDRLQSFNITMIQLNTSFLCRVFLYGDSNFTTNSNHEILNIVIGYLMDTNRFNGPLF